MPEFTIHNHQKLLCFWGMHTGVHAPEPQFLGHGTLVCLPQTPYFWGMLPQTPYFWGMLPQTPYFWGMLPQTPNLWGMLPQTPAACLGGGQRLNGRLLALLLGCVLVLGTLIAPLVRASDITYYPPLVLPAPLRTSFEIDREDTILDKDFHPNNQREIVGSRTTLRARYVSADKRFHTFFAMSDESLGENHFVRKNYGENRRNEFHVGSIIAFGMWPLETEIGLIRREDIFFDGVGGRIAQHYGFHWRNWQGTASVGIDYMQEESLRRLVDSFSTIGYSRESLRSTLASQVRYSGGVVFTRPGQRFSFIQGIEAHETPFFDIPTGIHENLGSPALESSYHLRTIWHAFGIESHGDIRDLHPFASFQRTAHETTIGVGLVVQ